MGRPDRLRRSQRPAVRHFLTPHCWRRRLVPPAGQRSERRPFPTPPNASTVSWNFRDWQLAACTVAPRVPFLVAERRGRGMAKTPPATILAAPFDGLDSCVLWLVFPLRRHPLDQKRVLLVVCCLPTALTPKTNTRFSLPPTHNSSNARCKRPNRAGAGRM